MATCKNCGASIPNDALFCVECGSAVEVKKGLKDRFKIKKSVKKDKPAPVEEAEPIEIKEDAPIVTDSDAEFDSIEEEAKNWVDDISAEPSATPVGDTSDMGFDHTPQNGIKPTETYIPKVKNNVADKSLGLLIFLLITAFVVAGFIFNPSLIVPETLSLSLSGFAPLFLMALALLISARTGNFDLSLPGIMVVTYFLLMSGYNQMNYYSVLIICFGGAICIGLLNGLLTSLLQIPSVYSGLAILILEFLYLDALFASGANFSAVIYTAFSVHYLPISLIILSMIAVFVLIFLTKLGKPIYKRKGLTGSARLLYVLSFALAAALAAASGTIASITTPDIMTSFSGAISMTLNYTMGIIFIIAIAGSSSLFDNRFMPVVMTLIGFFLWFGIDVIIGNTLLITHGALIALTAKTGFVLLALTADRVYFKSQTPDFYQSTHIKK